MLQISCEALPLQMSANPQATVVVTAKLFPVK
jgi:hypothetical protein